MIYIVPHTQKEIYWSIQCFGFGEEECSAEKESAMQVGFNLPSKIDELHFQVETALSYPGNEKAGILF